jgi:hypothetical protein
MAATKTITSQSFAKGALATYFLFQVFYGFTYTPLQGVIPAEALDTNIRAKGLAASGLIVGAMGFINTFCTPIANASIGYRYIYIFVGWDILESILWYLFWWVPILTAAWLLQREANLSSLSASSLRAVLWRSLSTSMNSQTPSRPRCMLTRLSSRPMARSRRRWWMMLFK